MINIDNVKLSQLINARLCHDLAAQIGNVDNCFDLTEHKNLDIAKKAKNLAQKELKHLVRKIKFYSISYGFVDTEVVPLDDIKKLLYDFFIDSNIVINFNFDEALTVLNVEVATASVTLVSTLAEKMSLSGKIDFYLDKDKKQPVRLIATPNISVIKTYNFDILRGNYNSNIDAYNCIEYYISYLCAKQNYKISILQNAGNVECSFFQIGSRQC